jgi:hypothetical protein
VKLRRTAHVAALEAGAAHLGEWRRDTKGYLSDQGVEVGVRSGVFHRFGEGSTVEVRSAEFV